MQSLTAQNSLAKTTLHWPTNKLQSYLNIPAITFAHDGRGGAFGKTHLNVKM